MATEHPLKPATHRTPALPVLVRWFLLVLAVLSVALGIVGLFLPVLPTVPFLLLAAWAAGLSSPRLLHWLESHPQFGAHLRDWRRAGVVRRRTKWSATIVMTASAISTLLLLRDHWLAWAVAAVMACVLAWLWLRPEQPP